MANGEHLNIFKQGVDVWNKWRKAHPEIQPDLRYVHFSGANLEKVNLEGANLRATWLDGANLRGAFLERADLGFSHPYNADLRGAGLLGADLTGANLTGSNLSGTILLEADLSSSKLVGVNLNGATIGKTIFGDLDLRAVIGLETIKHKGPSTIGIDTIIKSHGHIPEIFLRKAGVPQSIIEQIPALIGSLKPIDFYSCFISYSSKDQDFADRLYADLQSKGVRCWFAPHDLRIGDRFAERIEESIRSYDKLLIVLSENSVRSTWVEDECRAALEKEKRFREEQQLDKSVLFPIKLDEAIKEATSQWVCKIRRERHIGDFTNWKNHDDYQQAFDRLLRDLKAES